MELLSAKSVCRISRCIAEVQARTKKIDTPLLYKALEGLIRQDESESRRANNLLLLLYKFVSGFLALP
jgi:hypothetical protein